MTALVPLLAAVAALVAVWVQNVLQARETTRRARLRHEAIRRHPAGKALRREDHL